VEARAQGRVGGACTDEHHFARGAGIAHPVGVAAGADQIALSFEIERVHRQRDCPAALSSTDLENEEVTADQANPNKQSERTTENAF
jgi:hypothetical protein